MTLGYSWQEIGHATLRSGVTIYVDAKLISQSIPNNSSTLSMRFRSGGEWWYTTSGTARFTGTWTDTGSCATYPDRIYEGNTIFEVTKTIGHNAQGISTPLIGGTLRAAFSDGTFTATISNVSVELPKIPRASTWEQQTADVFITSLMTMQIPRFTKYVDSYYQILEIRNKYQGGVPGTVLVKTVNNVSSGGQILLTQQELETIYTLDDNANRYPLVFYMDLYTFTDSSHTTQVGTQQRIQINAYVGEPEPTFTYTIVEQDENVIDLLGSSTSNKIIQNASDLLFTITPTAKYSATISKVEVNGTPATLDGNAYKLNVTNLTTGTFEIKVTDSRNLPTTQTATKTLLEYISVGINSNWTAERTSPVEDDIVINATIDCYSSTIDGHTNTPTVQYSKDSTNWTTIPSNEYTFADNKITLSNFTVEDLIPYQDNGTVYLKVTDLLTTGQDGKQIAKGIPTFSYGKSDLQVNGEIFIADEDGNNPFSIEQRFEDDETYVDNKTVGYGEVCKNVSNNNWNSICGTASGFYMGNSMTNAPSNSSGWFYVIHLAHNSLYQKQLAFDFFSNTKYIRTRDNGTWGNWVTF